MYGSLQALSHMPPEKAYHVQNPVRKESSFSSVGLNINKVHQKLDKLRKTRKIVIQF